MVKVTGILILTLLLAGCVSPEQQEAADKNQCMKFGFRAGSDGFATCMMSLSTNRQAMMQKSMDDQSDRYQQRQIMSALSEFIQK